MDVALVMFKDDERRDFPIRANRTVVGRRQDCDLRIPTRDVSRQHFEVLVESGVAKVRDLGSSNGTFVNGKRVAESELGAGDRITVGPVTFVVQIDGKPATVTADDAAPSLEDSEDAVVPVPSEPEDTDDILDLGEIDFEFEDPTAAIEAMLDADDDDEDEDDEDDEKGDDDIILK